MLRFRDARIRTKLAFLLVVPVIAIVSLAAARLVDSGQRAVSAEQISSLASLSSDIAGTTQQLQKERLSAAKFIATPSAQVGDFTKQTQATDAASGIYTDHRRGLSGLPTAIGDQLNKIDQRLSTLDTLRQAVQARRGISANEVVLRYKVIIDDLVAFHGLLSQLTTDTNLSNMLQAVSAFAQAKAQTSDEQALGYTSLVDGALGAEQYNAFVATLTGQQAALTTFNLTATAEQKQVVDTSITGDAVQLADGLATDVARSVGATKPVVAADDLASGLGSLVDLMRWTEQQLDAGLVKEARNQANTVVRQVIIESVLVMITLALAIALAFLLARAMARALSRLREGALGVAGRDLPEAVAQLRDVQDIGENSPDEIARQVRDPIQIDSRDEIGQVAQAFNVVHREAVRVAAEQAALRTSVSAMFLNLARRSQALVDRMIGELDAIERGEEDPKRLAQLFQLDHLATRMRRNDENLLVLAGADSSPPRREDALLADVLRAAQSEVELYNRVEFGTIDQDVSISSVAVNDVVRLTAELFDNATRFSPPNTIVIADARRIGDYVLVQIEDRGLGMSPEQMAALNHRLAQPPSVDVASFRMMGLAVVGRLADRYGIKVELRPNPEGGTITNVTLPTGILVLPRLRGREPVVTRQRAPLAVERGPSANPPGWPMPSLPGLAGTSAGSPALTGSRAGTGTATLGGEVRREWTVNAPAAPVATAPPVIDALGVGTGSQPRVVVDDTAELPIFRATEAVWFRSHGHSATESWPTVSTTGPGPVGGYTPGNSGPQQPMSAPVSPPPRQATPPVVPAQAAPPSVPPPYVPPAAPPPPSTPLPPRQRNAPPEESWRTAADDGWRAAARAADPTTSGTTRSGLPKRVPSAQLVPGGVDNGTQTRTKRSPDEVRGLLSAYHRGVQRGRTGAAEGAGRPTDEENR